MPPKEQSSRKSTTPSRSERASRRPTTARPSLTFVNSQDPNSRSTIQRHTARHSNAQRRIARLQSLRGSSSRPRLLEWQRRRPSVEGDTISTTSGQSSASSLTISPAPGLRGPASAPGDISSEIASAATEIPEFQPQIVLDHLTFATSAQDPADEPLYRLTSQEIERCRSDRTYYSLFRYLLTPPDLQTTCIHSQPDLYRSVINSILTTDLSSTAILTSYVLAILDLQPAHSTSTTEQSRSQQAYTNGTRLLRARLSNPTTAASDINIQSVLLLIAYAADTRTPAETSLHVSALTWMVQQRGGLAQLLDEVDPVLGMQLSEIARSHVRHLTVPCGIGCEYDLRFPGSMVLEQNN